MMKSNFCLVVLMVIVSVVSAQPSFIDFNNAQQQGLPDDPINIGRLKWLPGSHDFWLNNKGNIDVYAASDLQNKKRVLTAEQILIPGITTRIENLVWSNDRTKVLLYTNSSRVWRVNSKGDYWYFDLATGNSKKLAAGLPASATMFAKFSPDNKYVAYVSKHNLYLEDLSSGNITLLTTDGTDKIINGTFDWVYEEEFSIRDGFQWSPDGTSIAFWRVDGTTTRNHLLINNTDSLYPFVKPIEYPKAGQKPSSVKIGVVNIQSKQTSWMQIPGAPDDNYIPRMEWSGKELMVVQLNHRQNDISFYLCEPASGKANKFYSETDEAWIDIVNMFDFESPTWKWIDQGRWMLWNTEKDGWFHIYKISRNGKKIELLTKGKFDANMIAYDSLSKDVYFSASPYDATQNYLYKVNLSKPDTVRVTPAVFNGTNEYTFSPDAKFAAHTNSNISRYGNSRLVSLPAHAKVYPATADVFVRAALGYNLEKFKVTTIDGIEMDGIMAKPLNFDSTKKYPVFFFSYGEPASAVAKDVPAFNHLIAPLIPEGYIGIAMDNRGTPVYKGRTWRKSVYKKIGVVNSRDQAMGAKEILKWPFIDSSRVAIHGWSGGGAMTLNLMFRYPEIYTTGVAVAAITNEHFYDNIYTERYMGLPQDDEAAYKESSPVTYAKNLKGHLLYMHGTGDDNVHYENAEVLFNELIRNGKQFDMMVYPNRTHGINEGKGTSEHLAATFMRFIHQYCPPGAR